MAECVYVLHFLYTLKADPMRTNIDIDDKLMDAAMAAGPFKTKREAVEAGLRIIKRRKAYADLLAARGTLHWDDSDAGWAAARAQQSLLAAEPEAAAYGAAAPATSTAPSTATSTAPSAGPVTVAKQASTKTRSKRGRAQ